VTQRSVVVAHRETMVAEALAASLARYPRLLPVAVTTSAIEGERCAERAHALVLDRELPGAGGAAGRLQRRGVRVVLLGEGGPEEEAPCISTRAPVASLAWAIDPESSATSDASPALTQREGEVLELVSRGLAGKQVARYLGISPKTVEQHKTRIFAKLGVSNQTAAVRLALASGLGRSNPWIRSNI
jgi:DNA-binding CsgD family transcriptional regulator